MLAKTDSLALLPDAPTIAPVTGGDPPIPPELPVEARERPKPPRIEVVTRKLFDEQGRLKRVHMVAKPGHVLDEIVFDFPEPGSRNFRVGVLTRPTRGRPRKRPEAEGA